MFEKFDFVVFWKRRKKKRALTAQHKPVILRPKSEKDCRFCRAEKGKRTVAKREMQESWQSRKGQGGRNKKIQTEGYFCSNK
jgi:hypothetical protein